MAELAAAILRHRRIGIDTAIFIYHLKRSPRYAGATEAIFNELERGGFTGITSFLSLMELSVRPFQLSRPEVANAYESALLNFPNLVIADLDRAAAMKAAALRANYRLRTPDALQVATCLEHGATALLSNDIGLRRIHELEILLLDDFLRK